MNTNNTVNENGGKTNIKMNVEDVGSFSKIQRTITIILEMRTHAQYIIKLNTCHIKLAIRKGAILHGNAKSSWQTYD